MSDGPFKNLRLGSRWKRFAAAVHNDAVDNTERCALASDALTHEILTPDNQCLLRDLRAYTNGPQLDLDPRLAVETIFRDHDKTAFGDTLQREMGFRIGSQMTPGAALDHAIEASVDDQVSRARSRIEEEYIHVRERGEMRLEQLQPTVAQVNAVFTTLPKGDICEAIRTGDRRAFRSQVNKKTGLDEGPSL